MKILRRKKDVSKKETRTSSQVLEAVIKYQEKTKIYAEKSEKDYIDVSLKYAQQIYNGLQKCLQEAEDETKDLVDIADKIYDILMETNFKSLDKVKEDFEHWYDWNQKFNT